MLFQKRVDRMFDYMREKKEGEHAPGKEYDPKAEAEKPALSDVMEKGDMPAMILSALLVIVPVCLVALLAIAGISRLLMHA